MKPTLTTTLHSFLAIGSGFLVTAALMGAATVIVARLPGGVPVESAGKNNPGYLAFNLIYSAIAAAAGGYVTARLAQTNAIFHVLMLSLTLLLLSALSALQLKGRQTLLYQIALVVITPLAALGGGVLRLKQLGLL